MNRENRGLTYLALLLAVLFWGFSFIATKVALQSFTPFCLIFLRFFAASLFFIVFFYHKGIQPLSWTTFQSLLILALLQPGLSFTFETIGLQYTTATKTSLIIATIPVVVLSLSAVFLRERIRPINCAGIILSLLGVSLLVFGEVPPDGFNGSLFGDLLIGGAVISAAIYMILTRRLSNTIPSYQITGMQILLGAVLFFPAFLWDLPNNSWDSVTTEALIALAGLTVFATIGAFLCYNYALTRIPAARASVCINGIPLVTAFGAWLFLGETLNGVQMTGAAVVLVAVFLANQDPSPRSETVPA